MAYESWYPHRPLIAGSTSSQFDVWGDTVNIASRLESSSKI